MGRKQLSQHDKSVKARAAGLKSYGWRVSADVDGFRRPPLIRSGPRAVRPDIVARKGRHTRIIEVETQRSFQKDQAQRKLLRRWASRRKNTEINVRRV